MSSYCDLKVVIVRFSKVIIFPSEFPGVFDLDLYSFTSVSVHIMGTRAQPCVCTLEILTKLAFSSQNGAFVLEMTNANVIMATREKQLRNVFLVY